MEENENEIEEFSDEEFEDGEFVEEGDVIDELLSSEDFSSDINEVW